MGPQDSVIGNNTECFLTCPPEAKCDESATCCVPVRTPNGNGKGPSIPVDDPKSHLLTSQTAMVTDRV